MLTPSTSPDLTAAPTAVAEAAQPHLHVLARSVRNGTATVDDLLAALDRHPLFALCPDRYGLLAFTLPGHGRWVVAFTSADQLSGFLSHTAAPRTAAGWLRATAADLIGHLPTDAGLLLDPDSSHALALAADWLHATPRTAVPATSAAAPATAAAVTAPAIPAFGSRENTDDA